MSNGINLNLRSILAPAKHRSVRAQKVASKGFFWIHLSNMQNCQVALQMKGDKITRVICQDKAVYDAVATLKQAKALITEHGATEGLMAVFNDGNQLGQAIGIEIPEVTSLNYRQVGQLCCEGIDSTVEGAYDKVCEFFHALAHTVCDYLDKLCETSKCQQETLTDLANDLLGNIETIDAGAFATDEVFGFTQPVFMDRIKALEEINGAMPSLDPENLSKIEGSLKVLGYQVEEKVAIVEEPAAVAEAEAPAPEEVMSAPVAETPAEPAKSQEELEAEPQREEPAAIPAEAPADAPQEQEMAVFRWTPANLKEAVLALAAVIGKCDNIAKAKDIVCKCKAEVCEKVEKINTLEGDAKVAADADIDKCRKFASTVGTIAQLYGTACSHMVDQCVAMCGKLKKAEVPEQAPVATPVEEVTEAKPLGNVRRSTIRRSKVKNEFEGGDVTEHEFKPEEQTDTPAGTLPDDSEGEGKGDPAPTSGNEPSASSTTGDATERYHAVFNEFQGGDVDDNEFEPEKQMEDPAGTLPDDTEGEGKDGDGDSDPAGALEEGTEGPVSGEPAPSSGATNRRRLRNARQYRWFDEEGAPEQAPQAPIPEEPIQPAQAPQEPTETTPPATPVNPDGSPIQEEPLVPPQPAVTNEGGVEEPEGLPNGEAAPEPLDEPAEGVCPNGNPDVPDAVTEPHREVVETPPEDIPGESAEQRINDTRFRWF